MTEMHIDRGKSKKTEVKTLRTDQNFQHYRVAVVVAGEIRINCPKSQSLYQVLNKRKNKFVLCQIACHIVSHVKISINKLYVVNINYCK